MNGVDQHDDVVVYNNLVSSAASDKSSRVEAPDATKSVEPFSATNGAGSFRLFDDRKEIERTAYLAGESIRKTLGG